MKKMTLDTALLILTKSEHFGEMTPMEQALWTVIADLRNQPQTPKKATRSQQIKSLMEDSGYTRKEAAALADAGFGEAA